MRRTLLTVIIVMAMLLTSIGGVTSSIAESPSEPLTLRMFGVDGSTEVDGVPVFLSDWIKNNNEMWQKLTGDLLERGLKLEVELLEDEQFTAGLAAQIASGLKYDYVRISSLDQTTRINLATQGEFLPINKVLAEHSNGVGLEYWTTGIGSVATRMQSLEDGNLYWLCGGGSSVYNGGPGSSAEVMLIRNDWLKKLDLPIPTTTEEFKDTLKKFQELDANGDGLNDETLRLGVRSTFGIGQWFGIGPATFYADYDQGKVVSSWQHANIKDYIAYCASLYEEGLATPSLEGSGADAKMAENKISGYVSYAVDFWTKWAYNVPEGEPAADTVGIVCAAYPGVKPLIAAEMPISADSGNAFAFTKQCDPKAAAILLDYIGNKDYSVFCLQGIEGLTWEYDENGSMVRIHEGHPRFNDMARDMPGGSQWNFGLLPVISYDRDRAVEAKEYSDAGFCSDDQINAFLAFQTYEPKISSAPGATDFAIATLEETDRIQAISNDFNTYSTELMTNLILGAQSMDDWDTYMADLERLGMSELLSIYQTQWERAQRF